MFTNEEIEAAKQTRDEIIKENIPELKAIYMAGEIVMWNEMQSATAAALPVQQEAVTELARDKAQEHFDTIEKQDGTCNPVRYESFKEGFIAGYNAAPVQVQNEAVEDKPENNIP